MINGSTIMESGLEIKKTMKGRKAVDKRRFLKIFSSTVILLLMLACVVTILLNSRYVQNRVLAQVTELLSEKLKTEVAVGGVNINIFDQRIQFLGVEVEDLQHRKMLQVKSLSAAVSLSDLLHHKVSISNARINGLRAEIHKENPDSAANYQFIIDAIQKESKGKKHKDKKPSAFTADVSRITLQNFNVQYNDQEIGFQKLLYYTKDTLKLIDIDSLRYNNDIRNDRNNLENNFINKKIKRNEEKNEKNQKIQKIQENKENKENKVFLIKKVKDKKKEMEEDKKKIIKSMSFYKKSKFRGVLRKGKRW